MCILGLIPQMGISPLIKRNFNNILPPFSCR
nr:MAG TPA_asm: hypothetical protein [Caudoviricetes sp.]